MIETSQIIWVPNEELLASIVAGLVREDLVFQVKWDEREEAWKISITGY